MDKQRQSDYNLHYRNLKKAEKKDKQVVKARRKGTEGWVMEFDSLKEAAKELNLKKPNICHVISGKLKSTGGYEFKYEIVPNDFVYTTTWDDICRDKGYENKSKGPSSKRILHRQIEGVECKKCGKCQKWLDIKHFVYCKQSWDKLRNTCNPCLSEERKKNKDRMTKYNRQYWIQTKEQQTERHKEWKKANREDKYVRSQ